MIVSSIIAGAGINLIGFYKSFMIFGSAIFTFEAGLLYTLRVDSYAGKRIGCQMLAGFWAGAGVQIPIIAVQVVLSSKDMPTGNAIAIFFSSLGGALSISIAQNILEWLDEVYTDLCTRSITAGCDQCRSYPSKTSCSCRLFA